MDKRVIQRPMNRQATVICLHSSASTGGQWAALRAQLEPGVRVLTPDFHGHGAGPAWQGADEDIVAFDAARIARLAESVPGGVHLVGHSYGGAIALRVALYHPESVTSVSVYEPVAIPPAVRLSRSAAACSRSDRACERYPPPAPIRRPDRCCKSFRRVLGWPWRVAAAVRRSAERHRNAHRRSGRAFRGAR